MSEHLLILSCSFCEAEIDEPWTEGDPYPDRTEREALQDGWLFVEADDGTLEFCRPQCLVKFYGTDL